MRNVPVLVLLTLLVASACNGRGRGDRSSGPRSDEEGPTGMGATVLPGDDAGSVAAARDGGAPADAGRAPDGGGESDEPDGVAGCFQRCVTADDCATPSVPTANRDNWACEGGVCAYLGCTSDAECSEGLRGDFVCRDAGAGIPGCFEVCSTVDDCATPSVPTADEDNWACVDGVCAGLGCSSDAECSEALRDDYTCRVP